MRDTGGRFRGKSVYWLPVWVQVLLRQFYGDLVIFSEGFSGKFIYNAPELLKQEIERKLPDKGRGKEVFFSSVTDPY